MTRTPGTGEDTFLLRCGACGAELPLDAMFEHIHGGPLGCPVGWEELEGDMDEPKDESE